MTFFSLTVSRIVVTINFTLMDSLFINSPYVLFSPLPRLHIDSPGSLALDKYYFSESSRLGFPSYCTIRNAPFAFITVRKKNRRLHFPGDIELAR